MNDEMTPTALAGDALVHATETFDRQPTIVEVLFAFSLVCALVLQRSGRAVRSGEGEWALHQPTIEALWPGVEVGVQAYLRSASDYGGAKLPTKLEFFGDGVVNCLPIAADVRLVRSASDDALWRVMSDVFADNWEAASESERNFLVAIGCAVFSRLR